MRNLAKQPLNYYPPALRRLILRWKAYTCTMLSLILFRLAKKYRSSKRESKNDSGPARLQNGNMEIHNLFYKRPRPKAPPKPNLPRSA